ncbi:MAG: hypothetical protein HY858_10095 [Candidatus Solibacter usitatus]|nr:hypothetical protein [Candidatus Solibacter usitatus]
MDRRQFALVPALAAAACARQGGKPGWPAAWDRLLVRKAVESLDHRYDPDKAMIQAILGPEYRYHTRLRECRAHPTRDSLDYALLLLEEGSKPRLVRAQAILDRVLHLQVIDPESKWYGIWGWYMEEPPDKMAPADWNWADFNGSLLLLTEFRHGARLGGALRARVREAIRHAAYSVKRRNVSMSYTNIAVKGTFVTLAASELLADSELGAYAGDRIVRLARAIDETGSFAEYNSPTYARVSITNLTRIRMYVKDAEARRRAALIESRFWLHLAAHWDAARRQFTGPMSRCYSNDAGYPVWIEKALGGRLGLANPDNRSTQAAGNDGETAIHDYRCPTDLIPRFLTPGAGAGHRELFIAAPATSGTSWFGRDFSIGSANRSDFWVQRRPLIGYFGDASRPARTVQLRVIKDGYDFSSALFFSVQQGPRILGLVNFRNPGGDKHISLDPIKDGRFECGRLFLELDFEGLPDGFEADSVDGVLRLKSSLLQARFQIISARFGGRRPEMKLTPSTQSLTVTLDFKPAAAPRLVRWSDIADAHAAFALELADAGGAFTTPAPSARQGGGLIHLAWGPLELTGATRVDSAAAQNAAFGESIGGRPVAPVRLSQDPLA